MQVQLRRELLGQPQPLLVVLEPPVGMDPRLHADLGRAEVDRLVDAVREILLGVLVGVGRALPCPKPQNAQPTMQMFETLMLRLTTNVTVSPASSRRSSSAAARMSSITSGRLLGEQRRQLLRRQRAPSRARADRSRREVVGDARSARRPEPRRGMNDQ